MNKINALVIQEILKKKDSVSVPWIQTEFSLDYKDAKEFLRHLMNRGWVETQTEGIEYAVIRQNLRLRKLERKEVDSLIEDMTNDCVSALQCIIDSEDSRGATMVQLIDEVKGHDDTREALEILTNHNLVYKVKDSYLSTVSNTTVQVLESVVKMKRHSDLRRRITGKDDEQASLRKLFDVLFEGD